MADIHYGVVLQDGRWRLIGKHLSYGAYRSRARAVRAARQLARACAGLPVMLHLQEDDARLGAPRRLEPPPEARSQRRR